MPTIRSWSAPFRLILTLAGIDVVGEASDGREAVSVTRDTSPDVILMDVRMPVMDGIETTRRITASGSGTRVANAVGQRQRLLD